MPDFRVLWVDDHWNNDKANPKGQSHKIDLANYESKLVRDLEAVSVRMILTKRASGAIADDLTSERFDALILDYELSEDPSAPEANAFQLLERLRGGIRSLPPIAVFSRYSTVEMRAHLKGPSRSSLWAVYRMNDTGAEELSSFLKNIALRGSLRFIVISDFHAGFLAETGGIGQDDFLHSLAMDIESECAIESLDGLIIPGDLAWRTQGDDLTKAYLALKRIAAAAGLHRPEQVAFCPGNHDLDLSAGSTDPWGHFAQFIDLLDQGVGDDYSSRFLVAWNEVLGKRGQFTTPDSLLSVVHNSQRGVVTACLNSSLPTGKGFEVAPVIEESQWVALQRAMDSRPKNALRIAVMHHPIFSAPGGVQKDDPSLNDQGKAMQLLAKMGFGLVFHGHTHFSGLHAHHIHVLNGAPHSRKAFKIVTISCPSVIAHPNSVSPHRQYFLLKLDAFDQRTRTRSLSLQTRIFNPGDRSWSAGEEVHPGEFDIDSTE